MSVVHSTSPFVTIYKRAGDVFTKLANPADLPASSGYGCAFSPDGTYMSVAHGTSPFVTIYKGVEGLSFIDILNIPDVNIIGYAKESGIYNEKKKILMLFKINH
jgi:hypothetical protein